MIKRIVARLFPKKGNELDPPISADTARAYVAKHNILVDKQKEEAMWRWLRRSIVKGHSSSLLADYEWPSYGRSLLESLGYTVEIEVGQCYKGSTVRASCTEVKW